MSDRATPSQANADKTAILPSIGPVEIQVDGAVPVDGAVLDHPRLETVADPSTLKTDAVLGMIDLVTIQQAYAANVDARKALDGVLATVAGAVGKV